jgi:DNA repair exonuclease SbcCD nuclease subunit
MSEKTSYKILVTADIHMSNNLPYAIPVEDGKTDRLNDQIALFEQIKKEAKKSDVDEIFILGDLFDRSVVDPITLKTTIDCIASLPCNVCIMSGNHDCLSVSGEHSLIEALDFLPNVVFLDSYDFYSPASWIKFWPIPFSSKEVTIEKIKNAKDYMSKHKGKNVALLHNSINECTNLGWKCDDGIDPHYICNAFDHVLAGHFHHTQDLYHFSTVQFLKYVGSPMQHDFGDVGNESVFWLVEFYKHPDTFETFDSFYSRHVALPKFHKVILDGNLERIVKKPDLEVVARDYFRYEIHATNSEWIEIKRKVEELIEQWKSKEVYADYKYIPIKKKKTRFEEVNTEKHDEKTSMEEFIKKYVDVCNKQEKISEDIENIKKLGLSILQEAQNV